MTPRVKQARTMFNRDKAEAKKKVKQLKEKMKEVRMDYGLGTGRGRAGKKPRTSGNGRGKGKGRGRGKENQVEGKEKEGEKKLKVMQAELDKIKIPEGRVTDDTIRLLQVYYGNAIRASIGHLEKMTDACWAVMYHSLSTDENPRHYCCPRGSNSWCKYQCALARGDDLPTHHIQTSSCSSQCNDCHTTIPADFEEYLEPQWRSLCITTLLKKCLLGATQNANESFNGMIWSHCPKTEYCNIDTVIGAVGQSVLAFNSGHQSLVKLMDQLDIPIGPLCTSYLESRDRDRVKRAQSKSDEEKRANNPT